MAAVVVIVNDNCITSCGSESNLQTVPFRMHAIARRAMTVAIETHFNDKKIKTNYFISRRWISRSNENTEANAIYNINNNLITLAVDGTRYPIDSLLNNWIDVNGSIKPF